MKLENDKIVIESRSEIDVFQTLIEKRDKSLFSDYDNEEFEKINKKLDSLYYNW